LSTPTPGFATHNETQSRVADPAEPRGLVACGESEIHRTPGRVIARAPRRPRPTSSRTLTSLAAPNRSTFNDNDGRDVERRRRAQRLGVKDQVNVDDHDVEDRRPTAEDL
jgi:hypothetical protein